MTVHENPDWLALVAGIIEHPDDDLRRLIVADWLEERASVVVCPACEGDAVVDTDATTGDPIAWCTACLGFDGWVSDGLAERAEFIRLQVELAALRAGCGCGMCVTLRGGGQSHSGPCAVDLQRVEQPDGTSRQAFLRAREASLFKRYCGKWWPGFHTSLYGPVMRDVGQTMHTSVKRGWPAVLLGPGRLVWGGECDNCEGTGTTENVVGATGPCPCCGGRHEQGSEPGDLGYSPGTGNTPAYGYAVIREHPVTKVVVTNAGNYTHFLYVPTHDGDGTDSGQDWFLTSDVWHIGYELSGTFETREDALDALSDAVIAAARHPRPVFADSAPVASPDRLAVIDTSDTQGQRRLGDMEPLTEWTTQELRDSFGWGLREWQPVVDELLRRERERCATVCDNTALVLVGHANHGYDAVSLLVQVAKNIREMG
jgi:uncharacterized protein (TIGR02996 family)